MLKVPMTDEYNVDYDVGSPKSYVFRFSSLRVSGIVCFRSLSGSQCRRKYSDRLIIAKSVTENTELYFTRRLQ